MRELKPSAIIGFLLGAVLLTGCELFSGPASTDTPAIQTAAAPVFNPPPGTYQEAQSVTLTTATDGAVIRYTMDGTAPTASSPLYAGPLTVSQTTTIKAAAFKSGMNDSSVSEGLFTISAPAEAVKTPVISPFSGAFVDSQAVSITCGTSGASIYYTLDGKDPTASSTLYEGEFQLTATATVKARAVKAGMTDSAIASETFTKVTSLGIDLVAVIDSVNINDSGKLDVTYTVTNQGGTNLQASNSFETYIYVGKTDVKGSASKVRIASWTSTQTELNPGKLKYGASVTITDTDVPMTAGGLPITDGYVWVEISPPSTESLANRSNNLSEPAVFGSLSEKSSDATLSNLQVYQSAALGYAALSPAFSSGVLTYSATVPNSISIVEITATKNDSAATVDINSTGLTVYYASLNVGSNEYPIVVTAEDGSKKTYSLTVTRESAGSDSGSLTAEIY